MPLSSKQLGLIAAGGSAVLLLAAFLFQAAGYAPCAMCIWQRYPHAIAIAIGALLMVGLPILLLLMAGAVAASVGVRATSDSGHPVPDRGRRVDRVTGM